MTFDLDEEDTIDMLQAIGGVLQEHLGFVPDMALIVRDGDNARTFFAGNSLLAGELPSETLRHLLEQALVIHNRRHPQVSQ